MSALVEREVRARLEFTLYRNMVPISHPTMLHEHKIPQPHIFLEPMPMYSGPWRFRVTLRDMVLAEPGWAHASAELLDSGGWRIGELPVRFFYREHDVATLLHFAPVEHYDESSPGPVTRGMVTYTLAIRGMSV